MKGKMMLIMGVLLIGSFFLYKWKGTPHDIKQKHKREAEYVTGTISNENGNPISRVTVYLIGSEAKGYSDNNGKYTIEGVIGDELHFSHPRYKSQTVEVQDKVLDVVLIFKDDKLKEQIKSDFPGAEVKNVK